MMPRMDKTFQAKRAHILLLVLTADPAIGTVVISALVIVIAVDLQTAQYASRAKVLLAARWQRNDRVL